MLDSWCGYWGLVLKTDDWLKLSSEELLRKHRGSLFTEHIPESRRAYELIEMRISRWRALKGLELSYGGRERLPRLCDALDEPDMWGLDGDGIQELENESERLREEENRTLLESED